MMNTFRSISLYIFVAVALSLLASCQDDGKRDVKYYFSYEVEMDEPPRRPGTTGVRIRPPQKEPLMFELLFGSSLDLNFLVEEFSGDELTAVFEVPRDGGKVRNVKVSHHDHRGAADIVKSKISSWVYSTTKYGKMTIVIRLMGNGTIQVDTSRLKNNGEREPKMGALYND